VLRLKNWAKQAFHMLRPRGPWPQDQKLNPWLDRRGALAEIRARERAGKLDAATAKGLRKWHHDGYLILHNVIDHDRIRWLEEDIARFEREHTVLGGLRCPLQRDEHGHFKSNINIHMQSDALKSIFLDPTIMKWNRLILDREVYGCQSIIFFSGSRRRLHHDHIHMTTRPYGYLTAAWIALEDIDPRSGPLLYLPGSQWLPYVTMDDVSSRMQPGADNFDDVIADELEQRIRKRRLKTDRFLPRRGDVLLWHSNLVHGGAPVEDPSRSRKSLACHYAAFGVDYYHEIAATSRDPDDVLYYEGMPYMPEYYNEEGRFIATRKEWLAQQARQPLPAHGPAGP
jgi:ectoine hydroxylase-related dioxygenase (phytanoyl-CoA dioxygenase family)